MRRRPYSAGKRIEPDFEAPHGPLEISRQEWLTAEEAAIVLKKFRRSDGKPSIGSIHTMIWRKQLTARKVLGRLLFNRTDLDRLIALSPSTGG